MPLPGTNVIPAGWSAHHRPTATTAMTAECTITRAAGAGSTGADGTFTPAASTTVYEGPCRAVPRATDEGRHRVVGEQQVTPRRYDVGVEYDTDTIRLGDTITFTAAQDAGLVGVTVRVIDVSYSSEQWQRQLITQEIQKGAA